jgi:N utilization substance protein B
MNDPKLHNHQNGEQSLHPKRFSRQCALQYLYQSDLNHQWQAEEEELAQFWEQAAEAENAPVGDNLSRAREFAQRLILGVLNHRQELDEKLEACANNWTIPRMSVIDRNLLRLTAFEILYCNDIPPLASINEAIELAKEFGDSHSGRFVNGILDHLVRQTNGQAKN